MPKFKDYITCFSTRVAGIPCQIAVTDYEPYVEGRTSGPPEYCYPSEGGFSDYRVLDRKGYLAPWLERKVEELNLDSELQDEIFKQLEKDNDDYDGYDDYDPYY